MATFPDNQCDALDYAILRDGGISLYRRVDFLDEDAALLRQSGYQLHQIDCGEWRSEFDMHESLARELSFPAYYGNNLDALHDVITDVDVSVEGGLALLLLHYDRFARGAGSASSIAQSVLDIFSKASHLFLLTGKHFLTLVQSDDPTLSFPKLGGSSPRWNRREWLDKDRGL